MRAYFGQSARILTDMRVFSPMARIPTGARAF
jgi:hypothetical protein